MLADAGCERTRRGVADLRCGSVGPDEDLERQIECRERRGHHHRGSCRGTAEDDELRIAHLEPSFVASPLWSITADIFIFLALTMAASRVTVSATDQGRTFVTTPSTSVRPCPCKPSSGTSCPDAADQRAILVGIIVRVLGSVA